MIRFPSLQQIITIAIAMAIVFFVAQFLPANVKQFVRP